MGAGMTADTPDTAAEPFEYDDLPENYLEVLDEVRRQRWIKLLKGKDDR
jgi:hypothetical protein